MAAVLIAVAAIVTASLLAQSPARSPTCQLTGPIARVPSLPEGSGIAVGRATSGRLWAHNDSGRPVLIAMDASGKVTERMTVANAAVEDWEAVGVGLCPDGTCVYVGDIGDNNGRRRYVTIYRAGETGSVAGTLSAEAMRATYPDRPQDAETLLVAPGGRLFIVTKGRSGPPAIYRFPGEFRGGTTVRLERVGLPRGSAPLPEQDRITDGAISPDGEWVALRTNRLLMFYRAADLLSGNWREAGRMSLATLREPQGEGVAFGPSNTLYLLGEGGGGSRPGTLATATCTF